MNKEIGVKFFQHPSGAIMFHRWICDGTNACGKIAKHIQPDSRL